MFASPPEGRGSHGGPLPFDPREQFAANLRRLRRRSGVSQERLAVRCGLHRSEISLLERGARDPRLSTIVRLARCLGVPPAELLARIGGEREAGRS